MRERWLEERDVPLFALRAGRMVPEIRRAAARALPACSLPRGRHTLRLCRLVRNRVDATRRQRVTTRQTCKGQPTASDKAVGSQSFGGIIGTRWQEPARPPEIR